MGPIYPVSFQFSNKPHLRWDEPPGWDGETIERSGHAPRDDARALFFTCSSFTARLTACSESELPVEVLNRGHAFPCSAPCLQRKRRGWVH